MAMGVRRDDDPLALPKRPSRPGGVGELRDGLGVLDDEAYVRVNAGRMGRRTCCRARRGNDRIVAARSDIVGVCMLSTVRSVGRATV